MKIRKASVKNFASYADLSIDFINRGLTLVSGPTGSGKSTLFDVVPWILFGRTAKNGSVDEIRSWMAAGPTEGTLNIGDHVIYRSRKPNDLTIDGTRGKDLSDTQRIINKLLGMDYELYLASAYMHEFSQTAQFFITSSKNRRALTEQLVDLKLAKILAITAKEQEKTLILDYQTLEKQFNQKSIQLDTLKTMCEDVEIKAQTWERNRENQIKRAIELFDAFKRETRPKLLTLEAKAAQLNGLIKPCPTCGSGHKSAAIEKQLRPILSEISQLNLKMSIASDSTPKNIEALKNLSNPHRDSVDQKRIDVLLTEIASLSARMSAIEIKINELVQLQDLLPLFRNTLISDTIAFLEAKTNKLISDHFDGEMSVVLKIETDDKLEVEILKNGNLCAYTQLSKGQRQILKLAFCVAVMECVQNHNGLATNTLWFDEILDGLDDQMKAKSFVLLEKLALNYDNIFVVDHSEGLKTLFHSNISVSLQDNQSVICLN